jgi:hypothetical protein
MRSIKFNQVILILGILGIVGFAATSFAGWGRGGGGYCWGQGPGWFSRGSVGPGYSSDLTDEQIATLDTERQAFLKDTAELRDGLYQKQLELRSELAKKDPDVQKALGLQKEISDLRGQLDQKQLAYRLKMQKDFPELAGRGDGFAGPKYGRHRMGPGYGPRAMGPHFGPGGFGPRFGPSGGWW